MKLLRPISFTLLTLMAAVSFAQAQSTEAEDSTGLPGDDFSLKGALELFKKSASPEEFEKLLNAENSHVNNLDLNGDGETDYIKVIDRTEKGVHAFVLQVPVSEKENQDIAVIELEKTGKESAQLQIIGDADIYGVETIIEPEGQDGDAAMLMPDTDMHYAHGPSVSFNERNAGIVVNVWTWPAVRFVYAPSYVVWVSPWQWHRRPIWWKPWRPVSWAVFRPRRAVYAPHYVVVHRHRVVRARQVYTPVRSSSTIVRTRYSASVGRYRATRTTTTIKGKNGNKVKVTKTKVRKRR
jgi:hypothetical protein